MKIKKTLLPLILVASVLCSSCTSYPILRAGTWQNEESVIFTDYNVTLNSIKIEIIENTDPDFVFDDFNAVREDGGEYLASSGLILYLYVDGITLFDITLFAYTNNNWRSGIYVYDENFTLTMRARLNNDRKNKTTYFETTFLLQPYYDNDPYSYLDGEQERCTPSTIYLYEV